MANKQPIRIKSISEYHQVMGLPKPEHPLISVINLERVQHAPATEPISLVFDFYSISLKRNCNAKTPQKSPEQPPRSASATARANSD